MATRASGHKPAKKIFIIALWLGISCAIAVSVCRILWPWWREYRAIQSFISAIEGGRPSEIAVSFEKVLCVDGDKAVESLVNLTEDDRFEIRASASHFLGRLALESGRNLAAMEDAVPALISRVRVDQSPIVRWQASRSLGWIGAPYAVAGIPALTAGLQDAEPRVRVECSYALARLPAHAKTALPQIAKNLCDPDEWVRVSAVTAIVEIGLNEQIHAGPLAKLALDDASASARLAAVKALSRIEQPSDIVLEALVKATHDDCSEVADVAQQAIENNQKGTRKDCHRKSKRGKK